MKKIILGSVLAVFAFAGHGDINDPGFKLLQEGKNKKAIEMWKKECNNGNGWACGNVGIFLYVGIPGIKTDVSTAKKYANKGCELHDIGSCSILGEMAYAEKNMLTAKGYFEKVCGMKKYLKTSPSFVRALYANTIAENCKRVNLIK